MAPIDGNVTYGPFPGWTARSVATSGDNLLRILWNRSDGLAALWLIDAIGNRSVNNSYGPYSGWNANALSVGGDSKMRVLWNNQNGTAAMWSVAPGDQSTGGGALETNLTFGPY